jgi:hypothetical protein
MKKLYYDCPIEAAYMAMNFGVKLYCMHTDEQMSEYDLTEAQRNFDWFHACFCEGSEEIEMISDAIKYMENISDKIYIHPDSLSIFEAMEGDLYQIKCSIGDYKDNPLVEYHIYNAGLFAGKVLLGFRDFKIIQRDNKPFLMPEVEA